MDPVTENIICTLIFVLPLIGLLIWSFKWMVLDSGLESEPLDDRDVEPWKLSEYYEHLQKVAEDIAKEKANRKPSPTVLWLVLDGLRLNEDGSTEWIHKDKPKIPALGSGSGTALPFIYQTPYSMPVVLNNNLNSLAYLQSQYNALQYASLQATQDMQTQMLINNLQSHI